jgi:glycosyltransferase involved in cell wall biosynthesis
MPKIVVISAVNIVEGGTRTVLNDCVNSAELILGDDWKILAILNNKNVLISSRAKKILLPLSKKSWIFRIYYEWFYFKILSRRIKPAFWLSLHDVTPRVEVPHQAVYCHNPSPFYKLSFREALLDYKFFLFNQLYSLLYRTFISRNSLVVVQQDWLRDKFQSAYGNLPIIVAHPHNHGGIAPPSKALIQERSGRVVFFFPSFPRVFKNFETLCKATERLNILGVSNFQVQITLGGNENRYARALYRRYRSVKNLKFVGLQTPDQMVDRYLASDAVVFPSKLETWGLPISEAKGYGKRLLLADLPYARETVGEYDQVSFFGPTNDLELAYLMRSIIENEWRPQGNATSTPRAPFVSNWDDLWSKLINAKLE